MDSVFTAFWVRFYNMWTGYKTVHRFDTWKEAEHFAKEVKGEIYDYYYNVLANYGFIDVGHYDTTSVRREYGRYENLSLL